MMTKAYICNKCKKIVEDIEIGKSIFVVKIYQKAEKLKAKSLVGQSYHLCKECFEEIIGKLR
jgi:hypothetical protein